MAETEKNILLPLDGSTYATLSSIVEKRRRSGEKISVTGLAKEILQEAAGKIEKERPAKYGDLEYLIKEYDKRIDRLAKLWFKSSRIITTMLLVFMEKMAEDLGPGPGGRKKVQERLEANRKQAVAILQRKEDEEEQRTEKKEG